MLFQVDTIYSLTFIRLSVSMYGIYYCVQNLPLKHITLISATVCHKFRPIKLQLQLFTGSYQLNTGLANFHCYYGDFCMGHDTGM